VELNKYLKPLLENLTIVSDKMRAIASKIDDQVNMVNGVFTAFRRITDNVVRFEENIQDLLEKPFSQIGSVLSNLFGRFGSFFGSRG
jgi:phage-related protein